MHQTPEDLEAAALRLPPEARGKLAAKLLESLEPTDAEVERLWIDEAERRAGEVIRGEVTVKPLAEELARIRASLR